MKRMLRPIVFDSIRKLFRQQCANRRSHHAARLALGKPLMPPHLLPRNPAGNNIKRSRSRPLFTTRELRKLRRKRGNSIRPHKIARMLEPLRQRRLKRLHQHRRAPHRRQRLHQPRPLRTKLLDSPLKRKLNRNRNGKRPDPLRLPVSQLAIDSFEIVKMMEHQPQRHPRPLSDPRSSRPQVALAKKIEQRINHRATRALGSSEASVKTSNLRHQEKKLITSTVQLQAEIEEKGARILSNQVRAGSSSSIRFSVIRSVNPQIVWPP